ncbi:chromatin modification- protein eaf6 [Coemansia sp. BCRC 34301]|nr:chromatin modification- protein eaf6 [Coemansia sp. BCRC 34301]
MSAPQVEEAESSLTAVATNGESDKDGAKTSNNKTGGTNNGLAKEGKITKKMLKEAEQELFQLLLKKKQLDRNLIDTENAIYDFETSYFENSGNEGNIVHGFDGYLNTGGRGGDRRQMHFTEGDRIFSQSSATFKNAQEAKIAASFMDSDTDDSDDGASQIGSGVRAGGNKALARSKMSTGGSTIKHNSGQRAGTPTPGGGPARSGNTKKIRLSIDSGN